MEGRAERTLSSANPTRAIWQQTDAIVSILQRLSSTDDLNHMFFRTVEHEFLNAKRSYEDQCIEMDVGDLSCQAKKIGL